MGAIANTLVKDVNGNVIVNLYRQSDGYQDCHGKAIKEFLSNKTLVNGIRNYTDPVFNGMGCLAAQLVSNFKVGLGLFYLYPVDDDNDFSDYVYTIYPNGKTDNSELMIKVECFGDLLYDGLASEYKAGDDIEG